MVFVYTFVPLAFILWCHYALFGVIILGTTSLIITSERSSFRKGAACYVAITAVVLGVFLNIAPNVYNTYATGKNIEVAVRNSLESELYGFKLMQLVLPRPDHRLDSFSRVTSITTQPIH